MPDVEWVKEDTVIKSDDKITITTEVGSTSLTIDGATPQDKGYYTIRATNSAGTGTKQIKVVVLSTPTAPVGPIIFNDVTSSTQSFNWLPPLDDGGCHISKYIVERCATDRQYWAPVGDEIKSCEAIATDLSQGKSYIYRIAAVNQYGQGPYLMSEPCLAKNACEVAERISAPTVDGIQRDSMTVMWDKPTNDGGAMIQGYILEKRSRIQRKWTRVTHELISSTKYRVRGLNQGTEYLFRVSAVNAAGTNEPSVASNGAIARSPIQAPSQPRNVQVRDSTDNSIEIEWTKPENDGGAKLTGFAIEMLKKGNDEWQRLTTAPVRAYEYLVENLKVNEMLKFRVFAINDAGESEPCVQDDFVEVKEMTEDPVINIDSTSITVKSGNQLRIVAYVSGRPEPKCSWTFNGSTLPEFARSDASILTRSVSIRSAERENTGVYTLTAVSGDKTVTKDVNVNVLSIPSAPTGPLVSTNIIKDSVTLEWTKPTDCGGTEVTNYIVEKREASRRSWTKVSATVTRTKFVVQGLLPDEQYMFRVAAENFMGCGPYLATSSPIVSRDPIGTPTRPEDVKYEDVMKSHVSLSWKEPSFDGGSPITHYIIEKRRVGQEKFVEASDKSFASCDATLTGFNEGDNFEFRVIAFNQMGAGKPSFSTKPVICRDTIIAPKLELQCRERVICRVGNSLQIGFTMTGKPTPKITWDQDNHELKSDERIRVKNTNSSSLLSVADAIRSDSGVYNVKIENVAGFKTAKVEVVIADKPGIVRNLDVVEVTREHVILKWTGPEDNGGDVVTNYVVEKKDMQRMLWLTVNNACLKDEIKITKLRENGEFQFRIMAENAYGLSDPVDTPTVVISDRYKVPDAPDAIRVKSVTKDCVSIEWNKPYDGGKRILNYRVEKRETQTERWVRVTKELITQSKYQVKGLLEGNEYEFRVMAENSIGYSEASIPSKPVLCQDPINAPSSPINIEVTEIKGKSVSIEWSAPRHNGGATIDGYIVETNKVGSDIWKTWCTAETQRSCRFTIPDLVESFEYYVRVKAVNRAGSSEPGQMKDSFVVIEKVQSPQITPDGNMVSERVVKAGSELILSAVVTGSPKPTMTWIKNDPINGDSKVENKYCHIQENQAKLIIPDVTRNMAGRYTLMTENSIAKKSSSCHVQVLDIPSEPRNLKISEVQAESLCLSWKQPSDNGGTIISHYRIERIAKSDQQWKPIALSHKKTNMLVKYLIEGETYKFRVFAENCFGMGPSTETEDIIATKPIHVP